MVESEWFEFWYRGLKPGVNFLPVSKSPDLCANVRRVVDWARAHPKEAKQIGQKGTELMTGRSKHAVGVRLHAARTAGVCKPANVQVSPFLSFPALLPFCVSDVSTLCASPQASNGFVMLCASARASPQDWRGNFTTGLLLVPVPKGRGSVGWGLFGQILSCLHAVSPF